MHKRMEDILHEAEAITDLVSPSVSTTAMPGLLSSVTAKGSWGFEGDAPPPLQRFAVELDQRFITELAHTAALFSELFEPSGRKKLLKACISDRAYCLPFCSLSYLSICCLSVSLCTSVQLSASLHTCLSTCPSAM